MRFLAAVVNPLAWAVNALLESADRTACAFANLTDEGDE